MARSKHRDDQLFAASVEFLKDVVIRGRLVVPYRGALVTKSADQTILDVTFTAVTFDQEEYDTDAIHDNVTNNDRLTVPAGVINVRLLAGAQWANDLTNFRTVRIEKNDLVEEPGMPNMLEFGAGKNKHDVTSAVVVVVAGDFFKLVVHQDSGANLSVIEMGTWFAMEIVETTG